MAEAAPSGQAARRPGHREAAGRDVLRAVPQRRRVRGGARRAARAPARHGRRPAPAARCAAAARSRGARRAPAVPAPARSACRTGPAAASRSAPRPRDYTVKVNRKARRRALRAALSVHARRGSVAVIDALVLRRALDHAPPRRRSSPSTAAAGCWSLVGADEAACAKSFRNIARVRRASRPRRSGVADVVGAATMIVSEAALDELAAGDQPRPSARESAARRPTMDARQVIHSPVISEKSYALIAEQQVHVPRAPGRAQDPDPRRGRGDLRRRGDRRAHDEDEVRSPSAAAGPPAARGSWKKAIVELAPGDRIELFEGAAAAAAE